MSTRHLYQEAYQAGRLAFNLGEEFCTNPYLATSCLTGSAFINRTEWFRGWWFARAEVEQAKKEAV